MKKSGTQIIIEWIIDRALKNSSLGQTEVYQYSGDSLSGIKPCFAVKTRLSLGEFLSLVMKETITVAMDLGRAAHDIPHALYGMQSHMMYDQGVSYTILLFTKTSFGDE